MSVFRPSARVTGPDGRGWEIYAYRIKLRPAAREISGGLLDDEILPGARGIALAAVFDGVLWLVGAVLRLLELVFWELPRAGLRMRGSEEWTIEAITWLPHRESYRWTTTGEFRGHVLAQVEGQLARGEVPTPRNATYLGASG